MKIAQENWVVEKVDNAFRWIIDSPVYSVAFLVNTYPLDSDISGG